MLYILSPVMSSCCCAGVGKNPILWTGLPLCEAIIPVGDVCDISDTCIGGDVAGTKGYEDGFGLGGTPRPVALPANCVGE